MIKRLYIDNFKCLVNFEYEPAPLQLIFGDNGSGKTTTFEVLERLRDFLVFGYTTERQFPTSALTAWQARPEQTFEMEIAGNGGKYSYHLIIEHDRVNSKCRVKQEELRFDGKTLYVFDGHDAHLFSDDFSEGPVFPHDWSKSAIASIPERHDNQRLSWFRQRMRRFYILAINPLGMDNVSIAEQATPDTRLRGFASWYRHLTQESPEAMGDLFNSLREVIDGFSGLKLTSEGETARLLRVVFKSADVNESRDTEFTLTFNELSEGQRSLIALFTIVHFAVRPDFTICIDEPDNFVALRELQPWLLELSDRIVEKSGQCLLISHHPELINHLAVEHGARFSRSGLGPVRVKPFAWSKDDGITPSEAVARGWED